MRLFSGIAGILAGAALALPAQAAYVAGPRFSLNQSLYVVNTVTGVVSYCFLDAAQARPVCKTAGTFSNPSSQLNVQTDDAGGVAWIHDRGNGRVMRCALTFATAGVVSGAACAMVSTTALP
jgi:hypothetical protein